MIKKYSLVFIALLCSFFYGFGQSIFTNPITGTNPNTANPYTTGQTVDANLTVTGIGRGSGITGANANNRYNANSWNTVGIDLTAYFEFTLAPNSGYEIDFISFVYTGQASGTGPTNFAFRSDSDGYIANIGSPTAAGTTISLAAGTFQNLTNPITFRLYAWGASASTGTFSINDFTFDGSVTSTGGSCSITASGLANTNCNDNGTSGDANDDYITFDLDPTGSTLGANYNVSVSSGSITPTSASYGSATTFTLQNGSAGAGDVTVTITDDTDGTCTLDQLISDSGSCATGSCTELMISEYVEGSSNNKYIEIYNPTATAINLIGYSLVLYANGTNTPTSTENLTGSIPAYGSIVYANSSATIYSGTTISSNVCNFNGDDAVALLNGSNYIDIIGTIGQDPGTAWNGPGGRSTLDKTLRRKATVQEGVTVNPLSGFPTLDSEWEVYNNDDVSSLGSHTSDCEGPTPELQLTNTTPTDQPCGFTLNAGSTQTNVSTNDVSFYITNVGSADLEITDLNLPAGDYSILVPATLPTVGSPIILAPFGGSQLVTIRFAPTVDGTVTNTLTITSNDANEGTCSVNLTGEGFTPAPNIVVRGLVGSNPTIANGSGMGSVTFLNNTEFSAQTINVGSQTKNFRIDNTTGTLPLTVNSITLTGDTADFYVTANLASPIAAGGILDFTMTFAPTSASGDRFALVTVASSDPNKPSYTFYIKGTANCPSVTGTISPTKGPVDTEITITSSNDLTGATATLNETALDIVSNSSSELVVSIPNTVTIGGSISVLLSNGCVFSSPFTLIDKTIAGCQDGNGTVNDLFISQVTDSPTGSLTYVELYNATGATIDFSVTNYILKVYNNGNTTTPSNFIININSGIVANNAAFIIAMGTADNQCTGVTGADGNPNDLEITTIGVSINFFYKDSSNVEHLDRGHDFIGLFDATDTQIDAFGIFGDETWATGLGLGKSGANFERKTTASIPEPNFTISDWNIVDWADCTEVDYSGIGEYDYSVGLPPLSSDLNVSNGCNTATITVVGTEGYIETDDAHDLTYQWYYFNPADATLPEWKPISVGGIYTLSTAGDVLSISDTSGILDYQFYCQVRESGATCYQASNATRLTVQSTVWYNNSGTLEWSNGAPDASTFVVIDANYDTSINGSFEACSLEINSTRILDIKAGHYVSIINDLTTNPGSVLNVEHEGSLVMVNDSGVVTNNGTTNVYKTSSSMEEFDYLYWSSPVDYGNVTPFPTGIAFVLTDFNPSRIYEFNTANFDDVDDDYFDDNGDDWVYYSSDMKRGIGYAAMTSASGVRNALFTGKVNNGVIAVNIGLSSDANGDADGDEDDWNLIGNPYPSAISADDFIAHNSNLSGTIYFWTHVDDISLSNPGPNAYNFSTDDYAMYNTTGGIGTSSVSGSNSPTGFIASGQGFFVDAITPGTIEFNNSMRSLSYPNDDFFRTNNTTDEIEKDRMWLNLTNSDGAFSQILVGFFENATLEKDRIYDGVRLKGTNYLEFYSMDNTTLEYGIQGRPLFDMTDNIKLGLKSHIVGSLSIELGAREGALLNRPIYLIDNYMLTTHDLTISPYIFNTESGEFKDRFEIVFTRETLSLGEVKIDNNALQIIELQNGDIQFKVSRQFEMKSIEITDLLGRTLYRLDAQGNSQTFSLSNLSQVTYLAKVKLTNGHVFTKKALKRK